MLPETHPDGDPFAAQDAAAAANSLLGRMEARARAEADTPPSSSLGFAPPKPPAPSKAKPRTSTASASGGGKAGGGGGATLGAGREILIDDSDDSDEDEEEEAQMTGDEGGGGSGSEDEEDGSGTDAGSEDGEGTPSGPQPEEDEDDEDDSEDDSEDDDASSKGGEGGEDVEIGDAGGSKPKSPVKVVGGANGEAGKEGDVAMKDGEAGPSGDGEPKKEKKKPSRKRAPRSPTPPPPAPKPPQPTIRFEIVLPPRKGSTTYPEFNIIEMARAKGLIPPEEVKKGEEENEASDAEGKGKGKEGEGTPGEGGEEPPKKKRKRGKNVVQGRFGGYDVNDPFVDDSEAQFYEPRFYARPRQEGFFVCTGEVEVAPRRGRVKGSKNKPKFDENGNLIPQPAPRRKSTGVEKVVVGKDHKPIHAADPSASSATPAFGATGPPQEPAKPARKKGEFSAELQADLDMLKIKSDEEPWLVKNKFPPALKDLLTSVAQHALELGEYDDDFFAIMPKIFPYNLFTLKKLIKREIFPHRIESMKKMQEGYLDTMRKGIEDELPKQRADFDKKLQEYEAKQRENGGAAGGGGGSATPGFGAAGGLSTPARGATPEPAGVAAFGQASPAIMTPLLAGTEAGVEGSPAPGKDDKGETEPKWRFRFNESMRHALYYACDLEDKMSELIVEKQNLEKATTREVNPEKEYSGKNARKALYQKIVNFWPQDLMNTNQLSREISNYRIKLKRTGELASEAS